MRKIAIVYWSGTGNTQDMARQVARGAQEAGKEPDLFEAADFCASRAGEYEALGLGCPAMGAEQLEETEFEPLYQSLKPALGGKGLVLFGSYGWGDGEWMRTWQQDAEACGARMLAEPLILNGPPDEAGQEACRQLGAVLAKG